VQVPEEHTAEEAESTAGETPPTES
jgi:hypothetical protein